MKKSWFSFAVVFLLLGLLGLLAVLQHQWLGQISDAEKERLKNRLKEDSTRFAFDFNNELQTIYFTSISDSGAQIAQNAYMIERYKVWQRNAGYPDLVSKFYLLDKDKNESLLFNEEKQQLEKVDLDSDLNSLREKIFSKQGFAKISEEPLAMVIPFFKISGMRDLPPKDDEKTSQTIEDAPQGVNLPDFFRLEVISSHGLNA